LSKLYLLVRKKIGVMLLKINGKVRVGQKFHMKNTTIFQANSSTVVLVRSEMSLILKGTRKEIQEGRSK